jgi:hypothetical protein
MDTRAANRYRRRVDLLAKANQLRGRCPAGDPLRKGRSRGPHHHPPRFHGEWNYTIHPTETPGPHPH